MATLPRFPFRHAFLLPCLALLLLLGPQSSVADEVWVESFTGMVSGEKPQGYRYDVNAHSIDIQIFFQNDFTSTVVDNRVFLNGGPDVAFSCSFDQGTGAGSCFATLPYSCGKATVVVQQEVIGFPSTVTSRPVDLFVFNSPTCLPQCDSCQLTSAGQAPGRPVNVATGKLWYTKTDFALSGPLGLRFARWYDNQSGNSGDLGSGWRHNYGAFLDVSQSSAGVITLHDEENRLTYFNALGAGGSVHDYLTGSDLALNSGGTTYTLTTWSGAKSTFDSAGRLASLADRVGNTQTISRDGSHRISTVTDPLGRVLTFAYDASSRISSFTSNVPGLPSTVLSMTYDTGTNCPTGNLCSVTEPDGNAWTYQYDGAHNLTKVLDPLGHAEETNTYSGGKCATQSTEGGQNSLNFTYGSTTTTVNDGLSRSTVYTFDPKLLLVTNVSGGPGCSCGGGQSRSFTWDGAQRKTSETDGDGSTHTVNYVYGRDATETHFDGFTELYQTYPSPTTRTEPLSSGVSRQTQWAYYPLTDPRRDLVQTETVPSVDTSGQNKVTTNTFSPQGLLTSRSEQGYVGGTSTTYTTSYTYDSKGRLLTTDGPRTDVADVTTNAYYPDTDSDLARRGQLKSFTDAVGNVTTYADAAQPSPYNTYDGYGHARSVTDPNAVVRQMDYDQRGRLTASKLKGVPDDTTDLLTSYAYDTSGKQTSVTLPNANGTAYLYDGSNRLTDTIRFDSSGKQQERVHITFDVMSQKTREDYQVCTSPANPCASWTAAARTESFQYDTYGRLSEVDHPVPSGSKMVYGYDAAGNLTAVNDENHAPPTAPNTTYSYDYVNRLTNVTQTLAGAPGNQISTAYAYDVQDNLKSVTDPNGNITTYAFDDFRRTRNQVSPVSGTTSYTYDQAGNILTATDANGAVMTRTYDAANRPLTSSSARSGRPTELVGWTYDLATSGVYGRGRLTSMADPTGHAQYSYDRRGLLRTDRKAVWDNTYAFLYAYDGNGNRTSVTYPSGRIVNYSFDFADRPISAASGATTYVGSAGYVPFGPEASISYGNGATKTVSYDQRYRPTENKLVGSTTLADDFYGEDGVGNVVSICGSSGTCSSPSGPYDRVFGYDDLNRLTAAKSGSSLWGSSAGNGYTYDSMGNIKTLALGTAHTATFTYSGVLPKLTSVTETGFGTRSVAYDSAGNESAVETSSYVYSSRNSLATGDGFAYDYDGRGIRTDVRQAVLAISGLSPVSRGAGLGGFTLTVNGTNFTGSSVVKWNGSARTTAFVSPTQLTASISSSDVSTAGVVTPVTVSDGSATSCQSTSAQGCSNFVTDFSDVASGTSFYPFVTILAERAITGGCGGGNYCPSTAVTRAQMAVFLLVSKEGIAYTPPACTTQIFNDVPCTSGFAPWINELANRGITTGCGGGNYCPNDPVTRGQMAVFLLLTLEGSSYVPPACVGIFADVPCTAGYAKYVEEIARRGVAAGCGGGNYCPNDSVTRGQMAVFLVATWGFTTAATPAGQKRFVFYTPEMNLVAETEYTTAYHPATLYEYIPFNGHPVAQVDSGTTTHWTFTDHLGTPTIQTKSDKTVYWQADYEPYGKVFGLRTANQHEPIRLPGQEAEELNLSTDGNGMTERSYNVFRWYRPRWGRYTQTDPTGLGHMNAHSLPFGSGIRNLFGYADMDPLTASDPDGLRSRVCCSGKVFKFGIGHLGVRHCYIETQTDKGRTTCSLYQVTEPSNTGRILPDEDLNSDGACGDWNDSCEGDQCVIRIARSYANPSEYHLLGPNSNTFAGTIARECGLQRPPGQWAPGWSDYGAPPRAGLAPVPSPCHMP